MIKHKDPRYYVILNYNCYDFEYDRILENKIGRYACTGFDFTTGKRDVVFYFYYEYAAQNAFKKLKRFKKYESKVKLVKCKE